MIRLPRSPFFLLALAAGGCDPSRTPCEGDTCPDISGVYSIRDTVPAGECDFTPYLFAPSVDIRQEGGGQRMVFHVIDPTTQLAVPLSGDVYAPGADREEGLLGTFRIDSRTTRLAHRDGDQVVTLNVAATGSVTRVEGRRLLSATLTTTDTRTDSGCTLTLTVTGESSQ
ncbi:MAG: hypothetical protein ABW123_28210 [Cystobacter sp.]